MKIHDQRQTWIDLILNPGQEVDSENQTGLDSKLLGNMIENGIIPADILETKVSMSIKEIELKGTLAHEIKYSLTGNERIIEIPLWVPWLCRRDAKASNKQIAACLNFMHEMNLRPWGQPLFIHDNIPVLGIDIIFPFSWDTKSTYLQTDEFLDIALSGTPKQDLQIIRDRAQNQCPGWMAVAKRAKFNGQFEILQKHGVWATESKPGHVDDNFQSLHTRDLINLAVKAGGNPLLARAQVIRIKEDTVMADRLEMLEEFDAALDLKLGRQTRITSADRLINTLAAGSISADAATFERAFKKQWPVHRNGVGLGLTALLVANAIHHKSLDLISKLIMRGQGGSTWKSGLDNEAAGLEGTGITEQECLMVAQVLSGNEHKVKPDKAPQFDQAIEKLCKQTVLTLNDYRLFTQLHNTPLWNAWANDPGMNPASESRKLLGYDASDVPMAEQLLLATTSLPATFDTVGYDSRIQRMTLAVAAARVADKQGDTPTRDFWADQALCNWMSTVLTTISETYMNKETQDFLVKHLSEFDIVSFLSDMNDCQIVQQRLVQFVSYLDTHLPLDDMYMYHTQYEKEFGSDPVKPIDFLNKTPHTIGSQSDLSDICLAGIKRAYLYKLHSHQASHQEKANKVPKM